MKEQDLLRLVQDALTTETFVHNATKVQEARRAVADRLEELAQQNLADADRAFHEESA